jgi:hypothetical protein
MLKRLALVLVSAATFAVVGALTARSVAALQGRALGASVASLDASARAVEAALAPVGADLPELAGRLASAPGLGQELKALLTARAAAAAARGPAPAAHARLEAARTKLEQHVAALRGTVTVDTLALVSDTGEVLLSDSARLPAGTELGAKGMDFAVDDAAAAAAAAEVGAMAAKKAWGPAQAVPAALAGTPTRAAFVHEGGLYHLAAAPLVVKTKVAGALVLERRLVSLPTVSEAFVVAGGRTLIGNPPEGFAEPSGAPERPFVLSPRPELRLPAFESAFIDALVTTGSPAGRVAPGLWAARFHVPGVEAAHGYVTADLTALFSDVAEVQLRILALAVIAWLLHAVALMLSGQRTRTGLEQLTAAIAAAPAGGLDTLDLDPRQAPQELRKLVDALGNAVKAAALTKQAELTPAGPTLPPLPPAPVALEPAAPVFELGQLGAPATPPAAPAARLEEDDGYRPLDTELELDPAAVTLDEEARPLPGAADALAAVEHLAGDGPTEGTSAGGGLALGDELAASPGPPPPVELGEPVAAAPAPPSPPDDELSAEPLPELEAELELEPAAEPALAAGSAPDPAVEDAPAPDTAAVFALAREVAEAPLSVTSPLAEPHSTPPPAPRPQPEPEPAAPLLTPLPADDPEQRLREVFEAFVKARVQCGESGEVGFERFRARLDTSRAAVMAKHQCKDVRFQVYVKDGRAAIKATPA